MRSLIILLPETPRGVHTSIKLDAANETPQGTPEEDAAISSPCRYQAPTRKPI